MTKPALADGVQFEADSRTWTARLTPGAFIELEDLGLGDLMQIGASMKDNPSFKKVVTIITAALRDDKKDITFEKALELCNEIGTQASMKVMSDCMARAFPDTQADEGKAEPPSTPQAEA